jgi:plasmid maintenance system antidote protein VapI
MMENAKMTRMPIILRAIVLGSPERMTVTEAAKRLRIGRVALSNVLNGNADLSVDLAARIEDVFRYSALDLLQRQAELKLDAYRRNTGSVILPKAPSCLTLKSYPGNTPATGGK